MVDKFMWNEEEGMFFDYDIVKQECCIYEFCMMFWVFWVGIVMLKQVVEMVCKGLLWFEVVGGFVVGMEKFCGEIGLEWLNW